jgi:hypothetical protein
MFLRQQERCDAPNRETVLPRNRLCENRNVLPRLFLCAEKGALFFTERNAFS